jgi:hypothetical protein
MADDQSKADVIAALSLICVDQSKRDPQLAERVAAIKAASSWNRGDLVMKAGWATMPGTAEANSQVAKENAMRTTRETVTFDRPFLLTALDEVQPAGTYTLEIEEELLEGLSFLAYRRVATTIYLPLRHGGAGSVQAVSVDPQELAAAHALTPPPSQGTRPAGSTDTLPTRSRI